MRFEVQKVEEPKEFESQYGKLYSVSLMGLLDGEIDQVHLNVKSLDNVPQKGEVLEGSVEETKFGKRFRKAASPFQGGSRSLEEGERIMRQSALYRAIQLFGVKAQYMKKEEVLKVNDEQLFAKALKYVEFYKVGRAGEENPNPQNGPVGDGADPFEGADELMEEA